MAMIERRQELAEGKVAGPAENDEVERLDGDNPTGHVLQAPAISTRNSVLPEGLASSDSGLH
jgi:hypothetical protein